MPYFISCIHAKFQKLMNFFAKYSQNIPKLPELLKKFKAT